MRDCKCGSAHRERNLRSPHVGRVLNPIGQFLPPGRREHPRAPLVIEVDDRPGAGVKILEQDFFRFKVAFHRAVIIKVILRQVREDRGTVAETVHPFLLQCVRRNLHDNRRAPFAQHLCEQPVQLERFRRCVRRRHDPVTDGILDGSDEPGLRSPRFEYRFETVVVFPFVPVTPTSSSPREGLP